MKPEKDWLDYVGSLGPCIALVGLLVGYWLAERSKRRERRLQMLKSVYIDVIADWANVISRIARIPLMSPTEIQKAFTEGLDTAAVNHHRMLLVAPLDRCRELTEFEPLVRDLLLPFMAELASIISSEDRRPGKGRSKPSRHH